MKWLTTAQGIEYDFIDFTEYRWFYEHFDGNCLSFFVHLPCEEKTWEELRQECYFEEDGIIETLDNKEGWYYIYDLGNADEPNWQFISLEQLEKEIQGSIDSKNKILESIGRLKNRDFLKASDGKEFIFDIERENYQYTLDRKDNELKEIQSRNSMDDQEFEVFMKIYSIFGLGDRGSGAFMNINKEAISKRYICLPSIHSCDVKFVGFDNNEDLMTFVNELVAKDIKYYKLEDIKSKIRIYDSLEDKLVSLGARVSLEVS